MTKIMLAESAIIYHIRKMLDDIRTSTHVRRTPQWHIIIRIATSATIRMHQCFKLRYTATAHVADCVHRDHLSTRIFHACRTTSYVNKHIVTARL
jgi:hypothetical protein